MKTAWIAALALLAFVQPASAQTRLHPLNAGQRERVISTLTRHHIGGQRHPQGIENRLHHFDLWHGRAIVLAVTTLAEPPSRTVADALALGLSPCPRWVRRSSTRTVCGGRADAKAPHRSA